MLEVLLGLRSAKEVGVGSKEGFESGGPDEEATHIVGEFAARDEIDARDDIALDRLLPLVYQDLRALAKSLFGRKEGDVTSPPSVRVREAYLRLVQSESLQWENRKHFFDVAAQKIRQLLVQEAQRRREIKRRGRAGRGKAGDNEGGSRASSPTGIDPMALDEALDELEAFDPQQARILSLRYFAGLTATETAEMLGMSPRTVALDSKMAHAWLRRYLMRGRVE